MNDTITAIAMSSIADTPLEAPYVDPAELAWNAKLAREMAKAEKQAKEDAERALQRASVAQTATSTTESVERSESPLNAPKEHVQHAPSEHRTGVPSGAIERKKAGAPSVLIVQEIPAPSVRNEEEETKNAPTALNEGRIREENTSSKVADRERSSEQRPSKPVGEKQSGRSPYAYRQVSADTGMVPSSFSSHSHVDPLSDEGQHASPSHSSSSSEFEFHSNSSSHSYSIPFYSPTTEFMGTRDEGLGEDMERIIAEEEAMMDAMKAEEQLYAVPQEEVDPLLARITDPVKRSLMLRMRAADRMPRDGLVTYPADNACKRRRMQYAILDEAWALPDIAPNDRLMRRERSTWLNMVIDVDGEGYEGEAILELVYQYFAIKREREIRHPRAAFEKTLKQQLGLDTSDETLR